MYIFVILIFFVIIIIKRSELASIVIGTDICEQKYLNRNTNRGQTSGKRTLILFG